MGKNAKLGIWLIVFGVPLNNYAYLHDLVTGSHQGYIYIGTNALIGIVVGILAILGGGFRAPDGSSKT